MAVVGRSFVKNLRTVLRMSSSSSIKVQDIAKSMTFGLHPGNFLHTIFSKVSRYSFEIIGDGGGVSSGIRKIKIGNILAENFHQLYRLGKFQKAFSSIDGTIKLGERELRVLSADIAKLPEFKFQRVVENAQRLKNAIPELEKVKNVGELKNLSSGNRNLYRSIVRIGVITGAIGGVYSYIDQHRQKQSGCIRHEVLADGSIYKCKVLSHSCVNKEIDPKIIAACPSRVLPPKFEMIGCTTTTDEQQFGGGCVHCDSANHDPDPIKYNIPTDVFYICIEPTFAHAMADILGDATHGLLNEGSILLDNSSNILKSTSSSLIYIIVAVTISIIIFFIIWMKRKIFSNKQ